MNCIGFLFVGYMILFFRLCFRDTKQKFISMVLDILKGIFVWNYVLSVFLSSYQNTILFVGVGFKWYSLESDLGKLNFAMNVIVGTVVVTIPLLIMKQVNKMRIYQDPDSLNDRLREAKENARRSVVYRNQLQKRTYLKNRSKTDEFSESGSHSSEDMEVENFENLIDPKNLPQRRDCKLICKCWLYLIYKNFTANPYKNIQSTQTKVSLESESHQDGNFSEENKENSLETDNPNQHELFRAASQTTKDNSQYSELNIRLSNLKIPETNERELFGKIYIKLLKINLKPEIDR
jgi:hypothetical protein